MDYYRLPALAIQGVMNSPWLFAAVLGVAMAMFVWSTLRVLAFLAAPSRRRLGELGAMEQAAAPDRSLVAQMPGRLALWLDSTLGPAAPAARSAQQLRLAQAGFRSPGAAGALHAFRVVLAAVLSVLAFFVATDMESLRDSSSMQMFVALAGAATGALLPGIYLDRRIDARRRRLMSGLPDALDLIVACTEGGLGLNAALERVADQLPASHPELALELHLVNAEMRAGVDRTTALQNLAERTGLVEIRGLVSLISHSARLGTGIAETLRVYAEEFRDRRLQKAEELAAMVGTKLILPLVACLWPAFFVVATGPAIVGVIRAVSGVEFAGQ